MVLPLPCEPVASSTAASAAQGLLHGVRHTLPHIHRHAVHALHHAARAAFRHPKLIAGAGCRAASLLIASSILAVPLPVTSPPSGTMQPMVATQPAQPDPDLPTQPLLPGLAYDPIRNVLPAQEIAKLALIEPLVGTPISVSDPADPAIAQPQSNAMLVAEPSSLGVLAGASVAFRLLRRRLPREASRAAPRAAYVPQNVCSTRSSSRGPSV